MLALCLSVAAFAQSEKINNYKYIIVPKKFDFFKEENRFNLNSLTKMIFEKQGFTAYFSDEQLPPDLALNRCRALYGDLKNEGGLLRTRLSIVIKDCFGQVLYTSAEGSSKEKDYQKAYYESLREASNDLPLSLQYNYVGDAASNAYFQQASPVAATAATTAPVQAAPQQQTATAPAATPQPASQPATATPVTTGEQTLFAQPIANGYQLVDTTPKVVLKMYKTSQADSYTAMGDGKNGVVFKKGNDWFFEYYQNDKLVSEKLSIKF